MSNASAVYTKNLRFDFIAGLVVFLVAIPLCLGVALASGAPLFSGIISGIIGGIIVGALSGSAVSVSGPAAGMAAVVVTAIAELGGFNTFLLALVLAGFLQTIVGLCKAGFVADYIPSNVLQGLLCAIGILLIIKQFPIAFSLAPDLTQLKTQLLETAEGVMADPYYDFTYPLNYGSVLISSLSILLLICLDKSKNAYFKLIPAPMLIVLFGILLNQLFIMSDSSFIQGEQKLVNIPETGAWSDVLTLLQWPNWSAWTNSKVYIYAFLLMIVASLESLLNIKAGEKLDKQKRHSSKNRELVAQGTGNLIAGLIGGIPLTSVIVRTSVNIEAGSRTKMSAIWHGIFLMVTVLLIPTWLNKIPLSSLAIILMYTGYKLTKPSIYTTIYKQGWDRFIPFIVTTISIVAFNLLAGVLIGLLISLLFILKNNSQARLDIVNEIYPNGTVNRLILPQQMSFLNKAMLVAELNTIPANSQLIIDARHSRFIDKEIIELIREFKQEHGPLKNIALNLIGFKDHYDIHDDINFINVTTYHVQATLTPKEVLTLLEEGNQRFLSDKRIHRYSKLDIHYTAKTQHPFAVILACIDSRVPVETIFDMSFGDLFCIRIAGNVVNNDILASMEYACHIVGAKLILVLGHTRCGAIQAACNNVKEGHITQLLSKIMPAIEAESTTSSDRNGDNALFMERVTALNVIHTMEEIHSRSSILKRMIDAEEIAVRGATYDVETGKVHFNS